MECYSRTTTPSTERVMGFTECNNQIYCATSDGGLAHIYKRTDGTSVWNLIKTFSGAGASEDLRGLSAVPNPNGIGEVLWMFWNNEVVRLDPNNSFAQTIELNVATFLTTTLGSQIKYVIAGYNDNIPQLNTGIAGEDVRAIWFEMRYDPTAITANPSLSNIDRWATDGLYLERKQTGNSINYYLKKIVDNSVTVKDTLVATRTIVVSPFAGDNGKVLFAGGFDCNSIQSTNAAWIYRKNY
jgi:hypothetical protein